jgi:hypothetical protein
MQYIKGWLFPVLCMIIVVSCCSIIKNYALFHSLFLCSIDGTKRNN